MGEQSASWAVDPVWTDQVEENGTREVDAEDLAATKARFESTSPQQPGSPSINMPETRSQTARSRPPNHPPSIATLEDDLRNLDVGDNRTRPLQPPAPEDDAAAERHEASAIVEIRTTPRSNKAASTFLDSQRDVARVANPNAGRCLITNRPIASAVQLCHLVAKSTDPAILAKLEYVWQIGYRQFHLYTRHNMLHLRADWHTLFDNLQWILVPEVKVLEELNKIYLTDEHVTSDLAKLFEHRTFRYYVVPAPSLREVICRFPDVDSYQHTTHPPPFSKLGPLESHIHPHYVIFNTGRKLVHGMMRNEVTQMRRFLSRNPSITVEDARSALDSIEDLYTKWMETKIPAEWRGRHAPSNPPYPPGEEGRDDPSQGGPPPKRQGLRSATRSQGQGSQASAGQFGGGQQRAIILFQPPEDDDSSSVTGDTVVEDDADWIEHVHNWQKQGDGATGRWESDILDDSHDEQLAAYTDEHARTPPSPGAWDSWKPAWDNPTSRYPIESDRSRFSSNDWAVFKNDIYLTRPEHPQVIL